MTLNRAILLGSVALATGLATAACGTATAPEADTHPRSRAPALLPAIAAGPPDIGRPTVRHLDPDQLAALQAAASDARRDGVQITVTSGWRSRAHQQRLWEEGLSKYGSAEEASRWVSPPDTSAHVTGDAVDIGPTDAADWLGRYGAAYGLCQSFANEIWHSELATDPGGTCPEMLPDSSYR
jgi:LAS superfamily LD-carboxypeptidase LdcB